jgi:hypothetical protein
MASHHSQLKQFGLTVTHQEISCFGTRASHNQGVALQDPLSLATVCTNGRDTL